ncbi:MAG: hypothetical protein ACREP8_06500, partial [Candidatus Binatia bacterium]
VVEALGYTLRMDPSLVHRERQEAGLSYGQYAAIRGVAHLGKASVKRVFSDYQKSVSWSDLAQNNGTRLSELISFMGQLARTTATIHSQLRNQPSPSPYRR